MTEPRILGAELADYDGMQEFFRRRADQLGFSRGTIDVLANFTPGLAAKMLADPPVKSIGREHIGGLCAAMAVRFLPVEDRQSLDEIERRVASGRVARRHENQVRRNGAHWRVAGRLSIVSVAARKNGKLGAAAYVKKVSPKRRSQIARKAANERWRKHRQRVRMAALGLELAASCS